MARISLIIYLLVHTFHVDLNYINALETDVCVDFQLGDTIIWYDDFNSLHWTGNNNVTNGKLKRYHGWYMSNGSSSLIYKLSRDFYCEKTVAYYHVFFTIYYGCNVGQNDTVNMYLNNDLQITAALGLQESDIYNETSVIKCTSNKTEQAQKWDYRFNTSTLGEVVFTKFQFTLSFDIHLSPQTQTGYIGISDIEIEFETPDKYLVSIGLIGLVIFAMGFCCFAATIRYSYFLIRRRVLLKQTEATVISTRTQICCEMNYKVKYSYVDVTMHYTRNLVFRYVSNHSNINNIPSEIINLCLKYIGKPIIGTGPYINEVYVSQKYYSSVNVNDEIDIRYDSKNPSNSNVISQGCSEMTVACTLWMCLSICVMFIGTMISVLFWTITSTQYLFVTMFVAVILILIIMILWYKQRSKTMVTGEHYTRLIN